MKKKKVMEDIVCSDRGEAIDLSSSSCTVCGDVTLDQLITPTKKKNVHAFWGVLFSVTFSLLLIVSIILLILLLFIHALNENVIIPSVGIISSDWIALFFDSGYFCIFGSALILIPILSIVLLNKHRIRRIFLTVGYSAIISTILILVTVIIRTRVFELLSGDWQDILVNATVVFRDFCIVCAIILVIIGSACLSLYSCIAVVKGGRHEKGN